MLLYIIIVFTLTWGQCKYLSNTFYIISCNCFLVCKCMYYIPLVTIPSYKSILIKSRHIPKFNFIFLQHVILIGPWKKNMILSYSPNINIFYQYKTIVILFWGISWMHILPHFIAWIKLLLSYLYNFGHNFKKFNKNQIFSKLSGCCAESLGNQIPNYRNLWDLKFGSNLNEEMFNS
jgi:hypothetical protein